MSDNTLPMDLPEHRPASRPYRPPNGTEGEMFMEHWCARCARDLGRPRAESDGCPIIAKTMALGIDDPDYPKEWREAAGRLPWCTAFEESPA